MPRSHDTKPFLLTRGPLIVSLESVFWHPQRYPPRRVAPATPPLHEQARPRELEDPFRVGHGHAFRVPLTRRGVVVGFWEPPGSDVLEEEISDRLLAAVEGAHIPGITATEIADWARARSWSWLELLVRRFPVLAGLLTRWTDSGGSHLAVDRSALERRGSGVRFLEWASGWVDETVDWVDVDPIDLEDARVRGADTNASWPSIVDTPLDDYTPRPIDETW